MANGLFIADIPGAVQRGLQFRQQEQLRPLEIEQARLGLESQQQQLVLGQQQEQLQQQQIETGAERQRVESFVNDAVQLKRIPDQNKLDFLIKRDQELVAAGQDNSDTQVAIRFAQEGRFDELNTEIDKILANGVALGILKTPQIPTSLQQNLIAAGLQPGTPEFQAAILKSTTKPLIGSGEPEEKKALARLRVERFGDIQQKADQATTLLDNLNQIDAIVVETGSLEPAKASFAAVIEGFGIDASAIADATGAQAVNAITGRLLNDVLNAATGPQTDQDADRARKTIASLGDTPGAFEFKNNSLRSLALRQVEQRDFIAAQLDEDKNLTQANKNWREFKRKTPSLSSVVRDSSTGLPLFFFQFKQLARERRPGISDQQIIEAWRGAHGK